MRIYLLNYHFDKIPVNLVIPALIQKHVRVIYNQIESIVLAFKLWIRKFSFIRIDNLILTTINIVVETINQNWYT